ncbi:MAG: type II toxin-antitoxin system HicB family antitoxin [bacterium]|nr:type II toxin-antitoxin system HicB family antitoxin [bacterium]
MKLKVVLEPSEDGGYTVYVPSLPGCISEGDTREEALDVQKIPGDFLFLPNITSHFVMNMFLYAVTCPQKRAQ